jgi:hypothetical protein
VAFSDPRQSSCVETSMLRIMLTVEGVRLDIIGLRLVRIAAGGTAAQNEMVGMTTEKPAAFTEAAAR